MAEEPITPPSTPPFVPGITDPKLAPDVVDELSSAEDLKTKEFLADLRVKIDEELRVAALESNTADIPPTINFENEEETTKERLPFLSEFKKKIESPTEYVTKRSQSVWNTGAGAMVWDENTGQERWMLTHQSGDNLNFTNKGVSLLATNNKQENILGDNFSTTKGDSFVQSQGNKEEKTFGDFTLIAGNPSFFTNPLYDNWFEEYQDIAAAKAGPELAYGGFGNNTNAEYLIDGTPAEDGSVEGGSFNKNPAQEGVQDIMIEKSGKLAEIESDMGVGGNIKLLTAKHILLQAGGGTASFDSGITVPNGRSVTKNYKVEDGKAVEETQPVPVYESKDTASAVPFGDVTISAGTKIRMNAGAGGVGIKSAGDVSIAATGRYTIGGAEVAIGGSTIGDSGRVTIVSDTDVFVDSGQLITHNAPYINNIAKEQITYVTPCAVFTGDLHVTGDLRVEGNIISCGFYGIRAKGDIVAGGGKVSLLNHRHDGVETGTGNTCKPLTGPGQN